MELTELFSYRLAELPVGKNFSFYPHGELNQKVVEVGEIFGEMELYGVEISPGLALPDGSFKTKFGEAETLKIVYSL